MYWVLDFYRILWVLLVVDIAVRSAKNLSHEEGNKKGLYDFISRNLLTVRVHRFPVRFLPCRFHYSSVP